MEELYSKTNDDLSEFSWSELCDLRQSLQDSLFELEIEMEKRAKKGNID